MKLPYDLQCSETVLIHERERVIEMETERQKLEIMRHAGQMVFVSTNSVFESMIPSKSFMNGSLRASHFVNSALIQ